MKKQRLRKKEQQKRNTIRQRKTDAMHCAKNRNPRCVMDSLSARSALEIRQLAHVPGLWDLGHLNHIHGRAAGICHRRHASFSVLHHVKLQISMPNGHALRLRHASTLPFRMVTRVGSNLPPYASGVSVHARTRFHLGRLHDLSHFRPSMKQTRLMHIVRQSHLQFRSSNNVFVVLLDR